MNEGAHLGTVWSGDGLRLVALGSFVIESVAGDSVGTVKLVVWLRLLLPIRADGASELKMHSGTLLWVHCLQG